MIRGWVAARRLQPAHEFWDGVIIFDVPEWREDFLAYCRARRVRMGYFDWGFEEEVDENPPTPVVGTPETQEY